MNVEELLTLPSAVSWTDKPFTYYIHTINRSLVRYFVLCLWLKSARTKYLFCVECKKYDFLFPYTFECYFSQVQLLWIGITPHPLFSTPWFFYTNTLSVLMCRKAVNQLKFVVETKYNFYMTFKFWLSGNIDSQLRERESQPKTKLSFWKLSKCCKFYATMMSSWQILA